MSMRGYRWGETTPEGITIDAWAKERIGPLIDLIGRLDSMGWEFLAKSQEGIIIRKKDWDRIKDRIAHLNEKMLEHEGKISDYKFSLDNLQAMLTLKEDKSFKETEAIPVEYGKDITGEFFILFDFLPEHIKKQLKIYVKNG